MYMQMISPGTSIYLETDIASVSMFPGRTVVSKDQLGQDIAPQQRTTISLPHVLVHR